MAIKILIRSLDTHNKEMTYELDQSLITFGRSKSCHIELDHEEVSRRHFILKFDEDRFHLIDESSQHGTMLDGVKLQVEKVYPLDVKHQIEVPGFFITLLWDGQSPKLERTTVVARNLLDELLEGSSSRECPKLISLDQRLTFSFSNDKTSFILGRQTHADFLVNDLSVGKEHVSFLRDINGICLHPLLGHEVFINDILVKDPELLNHGSIIKVGGSEFIYQLFPEAILKKDEEKVKEIKLPSPLILEEEPLKLSPLKNPLRVLDGVFLAGFFLVLLGTSAMLFMLI